MIKDYSIDVSALNPVARAALARFARLRVTPLLGISALPWPFFSRNLQAGYVIVAGMRGYARKLLTLARLLASLALPSVAYGVLRSNFLTPIRDR